MVMPTRQRTTPQSSSRRISKATSETARGINRELLWELIRHRRSISRADLARASGLQRSTVSSIIEQLIAEGWASEGDIAQPPRGRRPTLLVVNPAAACVVVDIHPKHVAVGAANLTGELLQRFTLELSADPQETLVRLCTQIHQMIASMPQQHFLGVGVAAPGRVDPSTQKLIFAPNLSWPEFDIKGYLQRELGLPVEMENAANACLRSLLWWGELKGSSNAVLVAISEGIGAGLYIDGKVASGVRGMAGEFGHIAMASEGPKCSCGQRGCWETLASTRAALRAYASFNPDGKKIEYADLLHMAVAGDRYAAKALRLQATKIGEGLATIGAALAPELILLTGEFTKAWERFGPVVENVYQSRLLRGAQPARLLTTSGGETARLRGAAVTIFAHLSGAGRA